MNKYYTGDIGTEIIVDCGSDITGATSPKIHIKKPNGTTVSKTASVHTIDGETRYLRYITITGDLDQVGEYRVQAGLTLAGWSGRGETALFSVYGTFE
jgi:hypothetical protein